MPAIWLEMDFTLLEFMVRCFALVASVTNLSQFVKPRCKSRIRHLQLALTRFELCVKESST